MVFWHVYLSTKIPNQVLCAKEMVILRQYEKLESLNVKEQSLVIQK